MEFAYTALDQKGTNVSGDLKAETEEEANEQLAGRGLIPISVTAHRLESTGGGLHALQLRLTRVTAPELIIFTKQFATMLRAGVPMLRILDILENQTENIRLRAVVCGVGKDVRQGTPLHTAFAKHPAAFSGLYCSMIEAGETSGSLPEVLDRLTYIVDHEHRVRADVRNALQYPLTVVIALAIAFVVLLTFVVPKFARLFAHAGLVLPLPTRICLFLSGLIVHHWPLCLLVISGLIAASATYTKTEHGKILRAAIPMRIPIIGTVLRKAAIARFASIFAILQSSGVPILESIRVLCGTVGNAAISKELVKATRLFEEGRGIAEPLSSVSYFTPMLINMVAVGEESGNLEGMLKEVAAHYDVEVEYAIKKLTGAIAPILTVGLAFIVGFFALAIYLPMWDLSKLVK